MLKLSLCGGLDLSRDHTLLQVTKVLLKALVALSKEGDTSFRKIRAGKGNLNWYEFLLSVDLPFNALLFPASWVRSYQSNVLSWCLGGRSLTLPGPLLTLPSPRVLLGSEGGLLLNVTSLVGGAKCRISPTATSKVMLMCSVSGFPGFQKLHSSLNLKNRNCAYKKKNHPKKVPPETSLKLPHFQQTAVKSLPSAPLRKGPDEGTAPNSSCQRSLWHAAACLDSMGVDLAGGGNTADSFG